MPRAESTKMSTQFYNSGFAGQPYLADPTQPSPTLPAQAPPQPAPTTNSAPKKKHVCPTCDRAFTTSGHLARHSRVHTGERNHKCPFPGCETRCSRQDNLQQHYRIHLSPGSRRSSTRSAISRAMGGAKRGSTASAVSVPDAPPPLSSPPALEQARLYAHHATPPDSPPPLAQATLPATAHLGDGGSSRSSSSPEQSYSQYLAMGNNQYSYRSGTTTYQEQSQGSGFTYVHTTPLSHSPPHSYASSPHDNFSNSQGSRHSISHITSYHAPATSSATPPSPASSHSVSSHTSGPPTPTYNVYDDAQARYHSQPMIADQNHHIYGSSTRFDSPPPTLAPIQERRDECHPQSHSYSPQDYSHYSSLSMGQTPWKSEGGLRKGVGALIQ
ncbi:transcriptional regulator family: C2H2 zinc finger [Agaricus bisporus var. burnettii]|uniref:Transcriptional regulator family: C2H2 zinc finger n=1 Tax=Agaricus bisporus var. burnettii TaxID=192524 RepID=A0A8H7F2F0_AGABI|nr:transcriptional regulator family: C2H2 zinc finger [Agaricus bisporus var. burnettii]